MRTIVKDKALKEALLKELKTKGIDPVGAVIKVIADGDGSIDFILESKSQSLSSLINDVSHKHYSSRTPEEIKNMSTRELLRGNEALLSGYGVITRKRATDLIKVVSDSREDWD